MKKSPKPSIWLAMTGAVAFVAAGGMYWQYGSFGSKTAEFDKLKSLVRKPYQVEEDLEKTQQEVAEAQQRLEHLEKAVPDFAYVPTLLKELELFGKDHGLDVFGVRPMPKQESKDKKKVKKIKEPYVELVIEVKGRGTYPAIASFVKDLRTFPKIVAARAVSLKPKNEPNATSNLLDMTIELRTFLFRPSKEELEALASEIQAGQPEAGPAGSQPHPTAQAPGGAPISNGVKTSGQQ